MDNKQNNAQNNSPADSFTAPSLIFFIVASLSAFCFIGFVGTISLILFKAEQANVALVSTMTGTALGYLSSLLSSTRTIQKTTAPTSPIVEKPVIAS
jgi:hypothetical protein